MLNRSALLLRYKTPAVKWINDADPAPSGGSVTLEEINSDLTVYLISDEVAESPEEVRRWVKANWCSLFESELEGWYTDPTLWPKRTLKRFDEWFDVECHSMLVDTIGTPIEDDEAED
ncbi:hypothetical protein DFP85_11147 [Halomonas ventosae]|uniref:Uncharacterized protein n=1 Tax=Halomonas ventosae TaxID=229007 RepID=A0A4R6ZK59_9GAMM|nr:hypothetical protein [Halomonas ventosae]TDR52723.1 hypothetical protein DFP85_11147 [Halomonas ventosae]